MYIYIANKASFPFYVRPQLTRACSTTVLRQSLTLYEIPMDSRWTTTKTIEWNFPETTVSMVVA